LEEVEQNSVESSSCLLAAKSFFQVKLWSIYSKKFFITDARRKRLRNSFSFSFGIYVSNQTFFQGSRKISNEKKKEFKKAFF